MALYGIDVSQFQAVGVQGNDFTIIRATYGTGYVDPNCDGHYQLAKSQGKLLGVYHYAYPQYNSPVDEADWFINNIQGYLGEALLVLDWEEGDKTNVGWVKTFLDHVHNRTGIRPLVYMSASVTGEADWSPVASDYALWCAGYPNAFNVPNPPTPAADGSDMSYNTGAWPFATIWQYSSSAGTLDRDIAYMDANGWHKFAQGDINVPPVETATTTQTPAPPIEDTTTTTTVGETTTSTTTTQPETPQPSTTTTTTAAPGTIIINDPLPPVTTQPLPSGSGGTVVEVKKTISLAEAVVTRALKTFVQAFLAIFIPTISGLTSNVLSVHSLSDAKALAISTILAVVAAILSALQNTINPPKEVTK